ncbi:MAG: response regulator, partial [Cyanobacteria bacterium J083]
MSAVDLVAAEINIMIVDDKVENLHLLSKMLTQHQYKVRLATSAALALKSIAVSSPDLILLDINMPDMNGYELCRQLKSQPTTQDIPVIFISAANQSFNKLEAFAVGGVDYITKPFDVNETIIRIDNQLKIQAAKFQVKQINQQLEIRVKERTAKLQAEIEQIKLSETIAQETQSN